MIKATNAVRVFKYGSVSLPDPMPSGSPEQVKQLLCAAYPELASAGIEGPSVKGNKLVYTFMRAVGTKG
ncbi:PRTRC system protein C [Vogesella indigofera]|uniref:PRTRC system protein C n=1 Tax=Vogesella indigofera TaxID=45465 RepID=A0ABT5I8N6_VOGIN|nr:PRTRC system protein C [Vogesella indigofera]MDC7692556.1 PRTRC system protein C [Vogesella indigofera]